MVTPPSGNAFTDLGFGQGEAAAVTGLRADIMARLRLLVHIEGLRQAQAAEKFSIAQSRVSDLLRGKWDKFSSDKVITLLETASCCHRPIKQQRKRFQSHIRQRRRIGADRWASPC